MITISNFRRRAAAAVLTAAAVGATALGVYRAVQIDDQRTALAKISARETICAAIARGDLAARKRGDLGFAMEYDSFDRVDFLVQTGRLTPAAPPVEECVQYYFDKNAFFTRESGCTNRTAEENAELFGRIRLALAGGRQAPAQNPFN